MSTITQTLAHPREAFPLAPEGGRVPHSTEQPSGPTSRPWVLRYAQTPDATQAIPLPAALYDEELQLSVGVDTDILPFMQTHTPTVPDGSTTNPPPLDEGPKD
ncbi:putative ATP-grasp-modified RiPP [Streptomyces tubercidicus]|uniref:putative ATP-grasp-modified RiPP n=1 Tax=Streptomyces tubercidicus TaxID=47759 RepID=UPI003467047E